MQSPRTAVCFFLTEYAVATEAESNRARQVCARCSPETPSVLDPEGKDMCNQAAPGRPLGRATGDHLAVVPRVMI
ncbi:hypothetical protein NDU88_004235 [Pleurodeles waltl]|uniref:Secreted protein n=1 Tax=Pleurodeles waltl TaxID=8319 RepID=A0AAV7KX67_PLEWA|nr:hypothetical protein NDU88_004235 [Pleurodeles waltl]